MGAAHLAASAPTHGDCHGRRRVLKPENRVALREGCTVFYLHAAPEDIARRLRGDTVRPLLQGVDALQRLQALVEKVRGPLYREVAHYVLILQRNNPTQVARKICMQVDLAGLSGLGSI